MPLQTKTFLELQNEIKREARVEGSDNLDPYVKELINELLLAYVSTTNYQELLVLGQYLTLVDATGVYELPEDFKAIRLVKYRVGTTAPYRPLIRRPQFVQVAQGRYPSYFDIAENTLVVYPFEGLLATDSVAYDYYKYPDQLVEDEEEFPIPRLIVPLKRAAIARVHVYNRDLQVAASFQGESVTVEKVTRHTDSPNRG